MAILKQGYVLQVQCDCGCKRIAKDETGKDFNEAWYHLMQLGWTCQALGFHRDAGQRFVAPGCK